MAADMTKGRIMPQLISFTVPLVLGNLFQLTYNAADSMIVGRYVGDSALAAVGTAGPIMNLAILFISGMCMGAGILMSTQYGAKDFDRLQRQISTTLLGGLFFSLCVTIAMHFLAIPILRLVNVPEDLLSEASGYLRIIFTGLIFTFIYNFLANTLRALGDSKTSLYFLIISAALNIAGDLLFVAVFHMGVNGSGISTVLSEMLCCLCCAIYIKKKVPLLCLGKKWLVFDRSLLLKTISYSITSALQSMCVQLGKVFVQTVVNSQGVAFMAAFTAINRVDDFAMTPQQNIAHASTTFMAQNRGAKQWKRLRQGFLNSVFIQAVYTAAVSAAVFLFATPIMQMFVGKESTEVIFLGVTYLKLISIMYIMPAATNIIQGFFRGMGDLKITLISTITNMSFRFLSAYLFIRIWGGGFGSLAWANFWGWIAMMALEVPLFILRLRKLPKTDTSVSR